MCLRPIKHKGNSLTVIYNQVYDKINASFNYLMLLPPPPIHFVCIKIDSTIFTDRRKFISMCFRKRDTCFREIVLFQTEPLVKR